jgi:putative ATP-binding cassette transporter
MILIAHHLTRILEDNKRAEAELRSVGAHLRESGEGTALVNARQDGRAMIGAALAEVIRQWLIYCWQMMRMTLVSHTNTLMTPVIGLLLCTPKFISGSMTLGEVVQAAAAFAIVQGAFNWISDSYARLAEWTSSANRVSSLLLALDQMGDPEGSSNQDMTATTSSASKPAGPARP